MRERDAADVYVYGLVDGSPQEFCNDEQPHERHEFLVGMKRFQCPGLPFGGPDKPTAARDRRWLWWSGFYCGAGVQLLLQMYLVVPHIHRSPWPLLYWFGATAAALLFDRGFRLVVRRVVG